MKGRDMDTPSVRDLLNNKLTKLNDSDRRWATFIKDFRKEILENSYRVELTPYMVEIFRYRLNDLLLENNVPYDIHWIIAWINGLGNQLNFQDVTHLWVPNHDFIRKLRTLYDSTKRK